MEGIPCLSVSLVSLKMSQGDALGDVPVTTQARSLVPSQHHCSAKVGLACWH